MNFLNLLDFILFASFLLESFRVTFPLFPFIFKQHLFHAIPLKSYLHARYHKLIQKYLKFLDIPPRILLIGSTLSLSKRSTKRSVDVSGYCEVRVHFSRIQFFTPVILHLQSPDSYQHYSCGPTQCWSVLFQLVLSEIIENMPCCRLIVTI